MSALRTTYKVLRSFLFTVITIAVAIYVVLYVVLSVPAVQKGVRDVAEREVSAFLGSKVEIGNLKLFPFNEVRLSDVSVYSPDGKKCVYVSTLGAGIHLWRLVYDRKIEITYAEIIGLDAEIRQKDAHSPLNIDFIIKAFSPKEKNKPPKKIDVKLHNIVIRKSKVSYDVIDSPQIENGRKFDRNHIALNDLRADVTLPRIKNDDFIIDLRRVSFIERSGLNIEKLGMYAHITPHSIDLKDINLRMPGSDIKISDIALSFTSFKDIPAALDSGEHKLSIKASRLSPKDFEAFYSPLGSYYEEYTLQVDVSGNTGDMNLERLVLRSDNGDLLLNTYANISGMPEIGDMTCDLKHFEFFSSAEKLSRLITLVPGAKESVTDILRRSKELDVNLSGYISIPDKTGRMQGEISSGFGDISTDCGVIWNQGESLGIYGDISSEMFDIGTLLNDEKFGSVSFTSTFDIDRNRGGIDAFGNVEIDGFEFNGETINNIIFSGEKKGDSLSCNVSIDDESLNLTSDADIILNGDKSQWNVNADIRRFIPSRFGLLPKYQGYAFSGAAKTNLTGNNADNITGEVSLKSLSFEKHGDRGVHIDGLSLTSHNNDSLKCYTLESDFVKSKIEGNFTFSDIIKTSKNIASVALPSMVKGGIVSESSEWAEFSLTVSPNDEFVDFFALPVRPYSDIIASASFKGAEDVISINIEAPYLVKGSSKMIRGTKISLSGKQSQGFVADIKSTVPAKNDDANLHISVSALDDDIQAGIDWTFEKNKTAEGNVDLSANISKNVLTGKPDVSVKVSPSSFRLNGSEWRIDRANVDYANDVVDVDNVRIWHAGQFVTVNGRASASPVDALRVKLAGIDLSYIFEALNINYVTFGGMATGEILASDLFTKMPVLRTQRLFVKDLSYNGAVLGDGNLESHWVNDSKKVAINADIRKNNRRVALIGGGVYVTRDSLSFDMLADHVNIDFLKPFMSAFTSDVGGEASGRVKLFGTFKDVDLKGSVLADSICMKVDYTNVYYHGSDSVYIRPGYIDIPAFKLYDKYGNSAMLKGFVKHRYFHEPEFEFRLSGARDLLCFDTNNKINPDWYGKIYASGGGTLRGRPGVVSMMLDVSTTANSDFTFVLSETQTASDYEFLTFSDRRKTELEEISGTVDPEEQFKKSLPKPESDRPSLFSMDIRCSVTPAARMTLVMDPKAGDRIVARGGGPMQISYNTDSDEMQIYGKYTLEEGNYNFSLQDLILRDFKIYSGSNISFNGDPMQGVLDITAAYRVNTNLSDLDKSFSTDRDLNRTNVPVDALLKVNGDMRSPEITFDIALPTLTQDVERKVKSIISTDDMMNRQIIYLLALNRFYTPEYMGSTSNGGGELASVASSTLSSQLSSFMGQLTDKISLAPSFRSDKGDFSDMEVDVALSSRLLDNRLLINGNFGYRDRATSQSTFVGDFDIEYLLNKNGNLRLKAYNHFNDQNYYLRSALTTQGIGVIYRRDFDNPFTFLKRKKKRVVKKEDEK